MNIAKVAAAVAALCLPLAAVSTPVLAASAHNSQAGANGDTKNAAAPVGMVKRMRQSKRHMKHM